MKKHDWLLASALGIALSIGSAAQGQSILDQQLDSTGAKAAATDTKKDAPTAPAPSAKPSPSATVAPQIVDPNASKAIDDSDLIKKLTNSGAAGPADQGGPQAAMKNMLDHMGQSQTRLAGTDTGAITQETQRRITTDLDVMIEYARQQQQNGPSQNKPDQQPGEKRQGSSGNKQGRSNEGGTTAATDENLRGGGAVEPESNHTDIHQKGPAEWGNLPGRDRDLVSNGVNEQYLPSYKELIDRYYQSLAEIGKNKDH